MREGRAKALRAWTFRARFRSAVTVGFACLAALLLAAGTAGAGGVTPEDVLATNWCYPAEISPDGTHIAYVVGVSRGPEDEPGGRYAELYVVSTKSGEVRPFITGKVNVGSPRWSPDGSKIAFTTSRGKEAKTQVWMIPVGGGESVQLTHSKTGVSTYRWHPSGDKIAYIATAEKSKRQKKLEDKGYGFVFYEENLRHRNLYMVDVEAEDAEAEQLTKDITVWDLEFNHDGGVVAVSASTKNLIDYRYMFKKIHILDMQTKTLTKLTDNPGKLGNYVFSPDGSELAYTAALDQKDHAVSQVLVVGVAGGDARNLTPADFKGHVNWVGWKDKKTLLYRANEGVWTTLSTVSTSGGKRKVVLDSQDSGAAFGAPSFTKDFRHFAMIGSAPDVPNDVYYWKPGKAPLKVTDLNPWVAERDLAEQEVVRYNARDGLEVEGILIKPLNYQVGTRYPLIVIVHGGPESNYTNGWLTSYSRAGQVMASKGYAVFYPNYRASTGYGVDFAMQGYNDAAGAEFDDIADGIDYLIDGYAIADRERVGLGGGSYGGYAAAWFSSYYTRYVKAVMMFVGISDLISKRSTTDIPYEELYVHSGVKLEDMWQESLERSPIYWAHQSETAVLIIGGTADSRVHPSQSLEYFRRLKMNDHPAVRLVQYPGEGHGNRQQTGQIDVLHRVLQWYDWYVKDANPLDGPMPPLDISDSYGIDLEEDGTE
jgi:dipeptidyl aminopeptidase/acylaminoacyl peptidase